MLSVNGSKYYISIPKIEKDDLENKAKEYFKDIFGQNSYYFEKFKLTTPAGVGSIPDGYVLTFNDNNESAKLYIIEYELSNKPGIDDHVGAQTNKFISALNSSSTMHKIVDTFISEIHDSSLHQYVWQAVSRKRYTVVIIIDSKNQKLIESFANFKEQPIILEFETYKSDDSEVYVFECVDVPESKLVIKESDKIEKKLKQTEKAEKITEKNQKEYKEKSDATGKNSSIGIMESIYKQVVELLKQQPNLTGSEIVKKIPKLQDYKKPANSLWSILDRYGNDEIDYTDDYPTKLYLIPSDKQKIGQRQFLKIQEALKEKPLTYNELRDAVPEFKEYKYPLNSLRPIVMRYGVEKGLIEQTNDRPLKLKLIKN